MAITIPGYLSAAMLAATLGLTGVALAQNNPGGPDDKSGTAHNIPGKAGTPGTFNAKSDTATSSAASGSTGSGPSASASGKMRNGGAPAGNDNR